MRPAPTYDRVLATLLFTDIAGSTARAAELGDARWKRLLEAHDTLVRRELQRYRGREVKTVGDGFLATFDGPGRAVRCGRAIKENRLLMRNLKSQEPALTNRGGGEPRRGRY